MLIFSLLSFELLIRIELRFDSETHLGKFGFYKGDKSVREELKEEESGFDDSMFLKTGDCAESVGFVEIDGAIE